MATRAILQKCWICGQPIEKNGRCNKCLEETKTLYSNFDYLIVSLSDIDKASMIRNLLSSDAVETRAKKKLIQAIISACGLKRDRGYLLTEARRKKNFQTVLKLEYIDQIFVLATNKAASSYKFFSPIISNYWNLRSYLAKREAEEVVVDIMTLVIDTDSMVRMVNMIRTFTDSKQELKRKNLTMSTVVRIVADAKEAIRKEQTKEYN